MKPVTLSITPELAERLNEELAYQATLQSKGRADNKDHGVEGQLITLDSYSRKALDSWTFNNTDTEALHNLRKIAAIAIRALLLYGCPRRD